MFEQSYSRMGKVFNLKIDIKLLGKEPEVSIPD